MARKLKKFDQQRVTYAPTFKPRNHEQDIAWEIINDNTISFLTGPSGTSKTYSAAHLAVDMILGGSAEKIYISRPAVDAGEDIGYLPGSAAEKPIPLLEPIYSNIKKITGVQNPNAQEVMAAIQVVPIGKIRGYTLDNAVCILDEAQNMSLKQLKLYLTRLGENSKMVICGDTDQTDIRGSRLYDLADRLSEIDSIGWHDFSPSAIVRHPLIRPILETIRELER